MIPIHERETNELNVEIGSVVTGEEDYTLLADTIYGVADGVSSTRGARASQIAMESSLEKLNDPLKPINEIYDAPELERDTMKEALKYANTKIQEESKGETTTATILHIKQSKLDPDKQELVGAYTGDSPAYIFYSNGSFKKLTKEQNIANAYFEETDPNLVEALDYYDGTPESIEHLNLTSRQKTWLTEGVPLKGSIKKQRVIELMERISVPLNNNELKFIIEILTSKKAEITENELALKYKIKDKIRLLEWFKNKKPTVEDLRKWVGITYQNEEEKKCIEEVQAECNHIETIQRGLFYTRNVITHGLGRNQTEIKTFYKKGNFKGAQILIMSDGITDNLTLLELKKLLDIFKDKTTQEKAEYIQRGAKARSEGKNVRAKPDDMGIVIVEIK